MRKLKPKKVKLRLLTRVVFESPRKVSQQKYVQTWQRSTIKDWHTPYLEAVQSQDLQSPNWLNKPDGLEPASRQSSLRVRERQFFGCIWGQVDTGHLTQSSHPWRIPSDWEEWRMWGHLIWSTQYIYLLNNRLFLVHWFKWEPSGGSIPGTFWVIFEQIFGHPWISVVDMSLCYFCIKACETVTSAERELWVFYVRM